MQLICNIHSLKLLQNKEIIKKFVPQNAKKFQAGKKFLKISKPAEICWGTPFCDEQLVGSLRFRYSDLSGNSLDDKRIFSTVQYL